MNRENCKQGLRVQRIFFKTGDKLSGTVFSIARAGVGIVWDEDPSVFERRAMRNLEMRRRFAEGRSSRRSSEGRFSRLSKANKLNSFVSPLFGSP